MTTLQDQLDEITANTRHLVQAERLAVGERAVEELFATGIEEQHPARRRASPRVRPQGLQRQARPLGAICSPSARLVIKFFRGRWCPYCMTELETWRDLYGQLRERGALMVAIGPQIERQSDFMAGQHGLPFPVLIDPGNAVAEKFGLVYTVPEYHRDYYLSILVNIPFVNGDKSWRLPLPATYVIAKRSDRSPSPKPMPTSASAPNLKKSSPLPSQPKPLTPNIKLTRNKVHVNPEQVGLRRTSRRIGGCLFAVVFLLGVERHTRWLARSASELRFRLGKSDSLHHKHLAPR